MFDCRTISCFDTPPQGVRGNPSAWPFLYVSFIFVGYHRFPAPGVWLRDGMDAGECPVVWMDVGWIALFQFVKTVISGEFMPEASLL